MIPTALAATTNVVSKKRKANDVPGLFSHSSQVNQSGVIPAAKKLKANNIAPNFIERNKLLLKKA